jgi:hypothetical protein
MKDDRTHGPRFSRRTENVPPAKQIDGKAGRGDDRRANPDRRDGNSERPRFASVRREGDGRTGQGEQSRRAPAKRAQDTIIGQADRTVAVTLHRDGADPGKKDRPRYAGYRGAPHEEAGRELGPRVPKDQTIRPSGNPGAVEGVEEDLPTDNLLTGRNPIREALRAGTPIDKLIVSEGDLSGAAREIISLAREKGIVIQKVSRQRLDGIYPAHQGMVAYVAQAEYSSVEAMLADAGEKGEAPFLVILELFLKIQ